MFCRDRKSVSPYEPFATRDWGVWCEKGFERTRCASLILLVSGDVRSKLDEQSVALISQMEGDAQCNRRGDDQAHEECSENHRLDRPEGINPLLGEPGRRWNRRKAAR